ncbi:MAG: hypothetical protein V3W52_01810 [Syntrophobacteria bacterium]
MKKITIIFLVIMALSAPAFVAGKTTIKVGTISLITKDYIIMNDTQYKLINSSDEDSKSKYGFATEYWLMDYDRKGRLLGAWKVNFKTIGDVGSVAKARVTLQGMIVRKIEVLDEEM